jgi:hypothetical protein
MAGLRYGIGLPRADTVAVSGIRRPRRTHAVEDGDGDQQHPPPPDDPSVERSTATSPKR